VNKKITLFLCACCFSSFSLVSADSYYTPKVCGKNFLYVISDIPNAKNITCVLNGYIPKKSGLSNEDRSLAVVYVNNSDNETEISKIEFLGQFPLSSTKKNFIYEKLFSVAFKEAIKSGRNIKLMDCVYPQTLENAAEYSGYKSCKYNKSLNVKRKHDPLYNRYFIYDPKFNLKSPSIQFYLDSENKKINESIPMKDLRLFNKYFLGSKKLNLNINHGFECNKNFGGLVIKNQQNREMLSMKYWFRIEGENNIVCYCFFNKRLNPGISGSIGGILYKYIVGQRKLGFQY
jgi:hypothetical protein